MAECPVKFWIAPTFWVLGEKVKLASPDGMVT